MNEHAVSEKMRSLDTTYRIIKLWSQFKNEIELSGALNYTDMNREAQNLLASLFRVIFQLANLRNLDVTDQANYPGIDLADDNKRTAFQITSDPNTKKVKETLEKFFRHEQNKRYDCLFIFILTKKLGRYTSDYCNLVPDSFAFDPKIHILDYSNAIQRVKALDALQQQQVLEYLEDEFGDSAPREYAISQAEMQKHSQVYVQPTQFESALTMLHRHRIVILAGPPHIGKSDTGIELLHRVCEERKLGYVVRLEQIDDWSKLLKLQDRAILLNDPFDPSKPDYQMAGHRFEDLRCLAKKNYIVIATRKDAFDHALQQRRIGESSLLPDILIELMQEGTYDDASLHKILENHIGYAISLDTAEEERISYIQANWLRTARYQIIFNLRFPHNIERLVRDHAKEMLNEQQVGGLIAKAKEIERAVAQWYQGIDRPAQVFAAILALFPHNPTDDIRRFFGIVCSQLGIQTDNIQRLARHSAGYIRLDGYANFAHPSFAEGVLSVLQDEDLDFAWNILHQRAKYAQMQHLPSLIQCRQAVRLLGQANWQPRKQPLSLSITFEEYFTDLITTYNHIIGQNFPTIRSSFLPKWDGEAKIHVDTEPSMNLHTWAYLRRIGNEPFLSTSTNEISLMSGKLNRFDVEARDKTGYMYPLWHVHCDITHSIPQIDALDDALKQMTEALKERSLDKEVFLLENWQMRMARLLAQLQSPGSPQISFNTENPLTIERIKQLVMPLVETILRSDQNPAFSHLALTNHLSITNWPPELSIGNLFIPDLVRDVELLEAEEHPVTGQFLVSPDLSWNSRPWRMGGASFSDVYTDDRLKEAAKHGLKMIFEAYKTTVELNFPTLYRQMHLYSNLPVEIICILDRTSPYNWDRPTVLYSVSPLQKTLSTEKVADVIVYTISESGSKAESDEARNMRELIWSDENRNDLWRGGLPCGCFLNPGGWRKRVIDLVLSDLNRLFGNHPFD